VAAVGRAGGSVFLLTDYGLADEFVGLLHAAIRRVAPAAPIVDLTHGVPAFDVAAGSRALVRCAPHLGPGVVVGVVDPGVGTARRPVALACPGGRGEGRGQGPTALVGPDNGLLLAAAELLGGVLTAVELPGAQTSVTFDGRDVFAPAAARLWQGTPLDELGRRLDPGDLVRLPAPRLEHFPGGLRAEVLWVDRFGNVQLAAGPADLARAGLERAARLLLRVGSRETPVERIRAFLDLEERDPAAGGSPGGASPVGLLVDANGQLAVVRPRASAAAELGLAVGAVVELRAVEPPGAEPPGAEPSGAEPSAGDRRDVGEGGPQ